MQLVSGGGGGADPVPDQLSQTGCVDPSDITQPYAGLVPYDLNAPFWSDGAGKDRHMGLPDGTTISVDADDDWDFPPGTVIVKNFELNGRLIETRHLMRHPDGGLVSALSATDTDGGEGGAYRWTPGELDALLPEPTDRLVARLAWGLDGQDGGVDDELPIPGIADRQVANRLGIGIGRAREARLRVQATLLRARRDRSVPRDEKRILGWNGLALSALSAAASRRSGWFW